VAPATVLLVEDEEIIREITAEALRELGYRVIEAEDGPDGLRALQQALQAPDRGAVRLLVTDVGLPGGLNGRQLADAVRALVPGLPVLLITGFAGDALNQQGWLGSGMAILPKPFNLDALADKVKAIVAIESATAGVVANAPKLKNTPVLMLFGDYVDQHPRWSTFKRIDDEYGHAIKAAGGKVLGAVRAPMNTPDFSSFLLQAQASKAKVIGLANAGGDTINSIKQAGEFGLTRGEQKVASLVMYPQYAHALGLAVVQGMYTTESFYWDLNDRTRALTARVTPRSSPSYARSSPADPNCRE